MRSSPALVSVRVSAFALLVCGAVVASSTANAQPATFEQACAHHLPATRITVSLDEPSYVIDNTIGIRGLTKLKADGGSWKVLGLTVVRPEMSIHSRALALKASDGRVCVRPDMEVQVQMFPQTVYVAREFKPGTCAYREILAHELRHVNTNVVYAQNAVSSFEGEVRLAFGNDIYYGNGSSVERSLSEALRTGWLPHLKARLGEVSKAHAEIDSTREYARLAAVCDGAVHQTLDALRP